MRPVMGSEYDVPYVHGLIDEIERLRGIEEQLQTAQRDLANADQDHEAVEKHNRERAERAEEQLEAVVGSYVCENCGRLGPLHSFNDDCTPGWTHGRMIKVKSLTSNPASSPHDQRVEAFDREFVPGCDTEGL